ncbi:MAG: STAS-like domain-containing protein [Pseudomonadota bacterium]
MADATTLSIRLGELNSQFVARSQGKQVLASATRFHTVILDFAGVDMVGHSFIDEVFRVFATAHPEVRLRTANVAPQVADMIARFAPHVDQD